MEARKWAGSAGVADGSDEGEYVAPITARVVSRVHEFLEEVDAQAADLARFERSRTVDRGSRERIVAGAKTSDRTEELRPYLSPHDDGAERSPLIAGFPP